MLWVAFSYLVAASVFLLLSSAARLSIASTNITQPRPPSKPTVLVSSHGRAVTCAEVCWEWGQTQCVGRCEVRAKGVIAKCQCEAVVGVLQGYDVGKSGCDPGGVGWFGGDGKCVGYLADVVGNVAGFTSLVTPLRYGKTLKATAHYEARGVVAIVKPPQEGFPLEPFAEVAAYTLDRYLGIEMVPPTVLGFVAVSQLGGRKGWGGAVWRHLLHEKLLAVTGVDGVIVAPMSIQLWIPGVRPAPFSEKFYNTFTPPTPAGHSVHTLRGLSNMAVLDAAIANTDRRANKNVHATSYPPRYLLVDQGKSFYTRPIPLSNPLSARNTTFCRFEKRVVEKLRIFKVGEFEKKLPKVVLKLIGEERLHWVEERVRKIVRHVEWCLKEYGDVAVWV